MGKGRGWFGERKRHADAARKGQMDKYLYQISHNVPLASVADLRHAEKIRAAISATEESAVVAVSVKMENAIEWIEEVTYGPKYTDTPVSKSELKKAYSNIDRLMTSAIKAEPNVRRKKQLRDVRSAARIARAQLITKTQSP